MDYHEVKDSGIREYNMSAFQHYSLKEIYLDIL